MRVFVMGATGYIGGSVAQALAEKGHEVSGLDEAARYIGAGANRWSNVHIDDLTDLYLLAIESAAAGDFFFAENGEKSPEIADAVHAKGGKSL